MPTTINITNHLTDEFTGSLGSDNTPLGALVRAGGREVIKTITLSANNTSAAVNVFLLTGTVEVLKLHGEITAVTTLNNLTGAFFDLWDGTNSVEITDNTPGTTMSGAAVGSFFTKNADALNALTFANNSQCRVSEGVSSARTFHPFLITAKTGVPTYIRFRYTTTDTPINAQLEIHCTYADINSGGITTV